MEGLFDFKNTTWTGKTISDLREKNSEKFQRAVTRFNRTERKNQSSHAEKDHDNSLPTPKNGNCLRKLSFEVATSMEKN